MNDSLMAAELLIRMTKRAGGGAVLSCVRADGSTAWQRQEGRQASFFPLHDLTHYAVETILGFRRGFFGLIADGWAVEETQGKGARGPLPPEAILVEHLVGFLDAERAAGATWRAEIHAEQLVLAGAVPHGGTMPWLTDTTLDNVRARRAALFAAWAATAPGSSLELSFARPLARLATLP